MTEQRYFGEAYKAKDGYRWRLKAMNGRIVADGGEAYDDMADVKFAFLSVFETMEVELREIEEDGDE